MQGWDTLGRADREKRLWQVLSDCYGAAEAIVGGGDSTSLKVALGDLLEPVRELGSLQHAAPGIVLTLAAYKACDPKQDITAHKDEHVGGFSARGYDSEVTVPFLIEKGLPRNVESHWLSQSFSFAPEFRHGLTIKTNPKSAGPLVVEIASAIQAKNNADFAQAVVTAILAEKVIIRNRSNVTLTRPKDLSIEATVALVSRHLAIRYRRNSPRLPQLVIFAVYQCIERNIARYQNTKLQPLARMKSADRKSDTIGDIVVLRDNEPVEAVEIKYEQPIGYVHVCEAIDKVRALSVRRYYMLSTMDVDENDRQRIEEKKAEFLKQNGCEIIINGILASLGYYLRLLPDTTEFIFNYVSLLSGDEDVDYEHRLSWNECCKAI